jgi:NDP-sugar pyrophosphorylase family protein
MSTLSAAIVLTAGLGTRLRPLTFVRAKGAVPVNGEPLASRIVRWLVSHGISDLVLNLHYKPETIAAALGDGAHLGARIRYSWEQPVLGSAGGPRHALPLLGDPFLVVNGDTLTDVSPEALAAAHLAARADVTMALIPNPRPDKYGGVLVSDDGWVTGFTRRDPSIRSYHFVGVQVAARRVFAGLPDGVPSESVGSLYPRLIQANPRSVRAFVTGASFQDIGTPADYLATAVELADREGDRLAAGARVRIAKSAHLSRTAVWDDVVIGEGASLVECVVADGARVPGGARYERCALVPAAACAPDDRVDGDLLVAPFEHR